MNHLVAPSLLAADFTRLSEEVRMFDQSEGDWLHLDVMDGHFVPNISFGIPVIRSVRELTQKPFDVHLMISDPDRYLEAFKDAGANVLTVHYEACDHLHRTVTAIRELDMMAGVAINPHTSVESLEDVLEEIDLVCMMSVNPGFGGQKFIYRTLNKIKRLKTIIIERNLNVKIEVDGGVGLQNAEAIVKAGGDVLVAGSSVFKSDDPSKAISDLKAVSTHTII
ncbi:MAG: ribulose-phosphate 3-epimerase [Saprospiraceae bacterium]|nr:ribulose-phosphate 3-epimerase [Saprospiraceae bacterium]